LRQFNHLICNNHQGVHYEAKNPEANVRILKIHSCPSVSGKSTLTYHIGCTEEGDIQFRIHANTNAGFFSNEWLPLSTLQGALAKSTGPFTSVVLAPLFRGEVRQYLGVHGGGIAARGVNSTIQTRL
jgi:hypothetical protein